MMWVQLFKELLTLLSGKIRHYPEDKVYPNHNFLSSNFPMNNNPSHRRSNVVVSQTIPPAMQARA